MVREKFVKSEKRKVSVVRCLIWLNLIIFTFKALTPVAILVYCDLEKKNMDCDVLVNSSINILLGLDITYYSCFMLYILFCSFSLIFYSWKYSRLEARSHMLFFVVNGTSMFCAMGALLYVKLIFLLEPAFYLEWRVGYYYEYQSQVLQALVYLLTKKNEDCFTCFNRLAP